MPRSKTRSKPGQRIVGGWRRLSRREVFRNPWFRVLHDEVIRPDGKRGTYDVVQTTHCSYVVPVDARGRILLIRQVRYTVGRLMWELPGGGLGRHTPLQAAKLELQEEAGLCAKKWKHLGALTTINGLSDELMHVYLATGLSEVKAQLQGDESIADQRWVSRAQAWRMVGNGTIADAQTVAALALAVPLQYPAAAGRGT